MGKRYTALDQTLRDFIAAQRMFFVATAPSGAGGHVNLSPKGFDSFVVFDDETVGYLDYVGSGAETMAHLRDNGRIVIMFCAFEGSPNILRLWGHGDVVEPQDPEFAALRAQFPRVEGLDPGVRAVVRVRVEDIRTSCGYGVPLYEYRGSRQQYAAWVARKGDAGLASYQRDKNAVSLDGLPALRWVADGE